MQIISKVLKHLLFLFLLSVPGRLLAQEHCSAKNDYDVIVDTITRNFFDQSFKGIDWPSRVSSYRDKINCSMNASQIKDIVNNLLAELKTSHTALYIKSDLEYWALKSIFSGKLNAFEIPFSGIWPVKIKDEWYAKNVLDGSPAANSGVRTGDKLIAIDGKPFEPLGFIKGKTSSLSVSADGINIKEIRVNPLFISLQKAFLTATKKSSKVFTVGDSKIGYFHLWCGTHDAFLEAMNSSLDKFKKLNVKFLIIDLRDGFGGAYPDYLKKLSEDQYFKKMPKYFLINDGVKSGKEWISAIIKRDQLGALVGTKTAGAFMAGKPFEILEGRYYLYLAVKSFNPPKIPPIEGIGVEPDNIITGCLELCSGVDPQLEKAIQLITHNN